ncbi:T9SS type A sorting domain-containing protein [Hanstruepera ponticola]|uniref:T9SS type A sorting domain-containing protein n=1 Tax=Hanstruepera ponticola TaxID=2042995 RepID=UPI00177C29B0|nr:T9SS type A sorting domain-containing protein [Hanstruepera ponticola]
MKKTLLALFTIISFSHIGISQTTFVTPIQNIDPNTGEEPYELASGDLDNDGDIDLVMATYWFTGFGTPTQDYIKWYENDGSGNFSIPTSSVVSSTIRYVDGLTVANIDNQFGLDIVATSADQSKLVYYLSDGSGGFGSEVVVSSSVTGAGQVFAADINNDGHIDLATVAYDDNKAVWFAGDGTGGFGTEQIIENGNTDGPFTIELDDFDGDTDMDVVIGFYNTGTIEIYYNQYIESGTSTVSWVKDAVTVDSGNVYFLATKFADVNNDGTMDVVKVDNSTGDVEWFNKIKNGASTANTISNSSIIDRPGAIAIADIDGDTFNDVILTDSGVADDAIIWFKGANNASPSATPTLIEDHNYQNFAITVDDYDGDGDLDIAFLGNQNDTLGWYENELITLGVEDNTLSKISVFPNPANDVLNFKTPKSENISLKIYDVLGKEIISESINGTNAQLNVSELANGIYTIRIDNSNESIKFIKQ